jgi:hypothetical protein
MRRGELLGLRWSDIDLSGMPLSVNCSLHCRFVAVINNRGFLQIA